VRTDADSTLGEATGQLSDEEIVKRVLDGDTSLFELIVRRHNQRLFRATRAILREDGEAEDVMQEAYVRAFAHLDQFAGDSRFSTWLTKIAVYEALARVRRATRQEELSEAMDRRNDPERAAYGSELQSAIQAAIETLPGPYRSVFVMREMENMSVAETAECLGISEENVKTRAYRAKALLRRRLERAIGVAASQAYSFLGPRCDAMTAAVMDRIRSMKLP
jgi:RNA polymerase sigma-70 factor (ECF subfamily)